MLFVNVVLDEIYLNFENTGTIVQMQYAKYCKLEMARKTKNASTCCAVSANLIRMLHHTASKHN